MEDAEVVAYKVRPLLNHTIFAGGPFDLLFKGCILYAYHQGHYFCEYKEWPSPWHEEQS